LPNQQAERAVLFKVRPPTSVAALWEEADDKSAVEDFPHPDAVQLLVAPRPFAQGAVRLAYHAQELPTATAVSGAAATALGYMGSVYSGLGFVQGFAQASSPSPTPCASAGAGLHSGIVGKAEPCTHCSHWTSRCTLLLLLSLHPLSLHPTQSPSLT